MSTSLQLIFFGELIAGFTPDEVRRNMAKSFKLDDKRLDRMFSGQEVVLKRNLSDDEATRYITHLATLGARVQTRPMPPAANTPFYSTQSSALTPLPTLSPSMGAEQQPWAGSFGSSPEEQRASAMRGHSAEATRPTESAAAPNRDAEMPPVEPLVALRPAPETTAARDLAPVAPWLVGTTPAPGMPTTSTPVTSTSTIGTPTISTLTPTRSASTGATTAAPLALADADVNEVVCPTCNERQPKRVLCRNCATNLDTALQSKAEDDARKRADRLDSRHGRKSGYGSENSRQTPEDEGEAPTLWGFGWEGRIGRLNYATGMFMMSAAFALIEIVAHRMPAAIGGTLIGLALVAMVAMSLRQWALRFHDRGHSGWWNMVWLLLVMSVVLTLASPSVGMRLMIPSLLVFAGASFYLLFVKGDDDDNAYGVTPREGSAGALLASIVAGFALSALAPDDTVFGGRLRNMGDSTQRQVMQRLKSVEAKEAYAGDYMMSSDHKAFAASPDGSWGWVADAKNADAAMNDALATCEKHRPRTQRACELVSVNGRTVP